ncbi:MAG: GNAT family N-acetyltransferase [Bacillota bacterium]|nr:GNAT family N-acetyltransferase [Bacillota bacterium]
MGYAVWLPAAKHGGAKKANGKRQAYAFAPEQLTGERLHLQLCCAKNDSPADIERRRPPSFYFDIRLKPDGIRIGRCELHLAEDASVDIIGNIGYSIGRRHRGRHYAAEAAALLIELARGLGMRRLLITCGPDNQPSRRTIERLGGSFLDELTYGVLPRHRGRKKLRYVIDL